MRSSTDWHGAGFTKQGIAEESLYSQAHIGTSGAYDLENEYSKLGVGINYMIAPKVTIGGGLMITPFDVEDDYDQQI